VSLRGAVLVIAGACLAAGLWALIAGAFPATFVLVFWGAIILLSTIFERLRYKKIMAQAPGPGWERTTERFIDDETGKPVTVYLEPLSGERRYVQE
jgi:uncharacterized membrane protein HdeD (DUF308 family)